MPAAIWSLSAGDAHLEELVEVRRGDRAELGPLEQRDPRLGGELEHPLVEREPAQLAVEESLVGHRRRRPIARPGSELVVGAAEVPLERDQLALGVADDALAVAAELRIVAGQQHEAGEHPGAELVEQVRSPQSP